MCVFAWYCIGASDGPIPLTSAVSTCVSYYLCLLRHFLLVFLTSPYQFIKHKLLFDISALLSVQSDSHMHHTTIHTSPS